MMNKNNHSISTRRGTLAACLLAFVFLLTQPDQALAQCTCPWVTNGNNINNTNTGNVGIGTTTPGAPLHVATQSNAGQRGIFISHHFDNEGSPFLTFIKSRGTLASPAAVINGDVLAILLGYGYDGTSYLGGTHIRFTVDGPVATGSVPAAMQFFTGSNIGLERMRITSAGNVGVGTTAPSSKLHVVGDVTLTGTGNISASGTITAGNIVAKYQDIAEWVPSRHALPAGTVVVLDTDQLHYVQASSQAYDTRVAGVVSDSPGVILGEAGEGKVKVATTGRVRVKVDATRTPIHVGDLLVTSDKAGIAMKSKPLDLDGTPIHRPGTILGKALEPLDKGVGEILVLLSLQ